VQWADTVSGNVTIEIGALCCAGLKKSERRETGYLILISELRVSRTIDTGNDDVGTGVL